MSGTFRRYHDYPLFVIESFYFHSRIPNPIPIIPAMQLPSPLPTRCVDSSLNILAKYVQSINMCDMSDLGSRGCASNNSRKQIRHMHLKPIIIHLYIAISYSRPPKPMSHYQIHIQTHLSSDGFSHWHVTWHPPDMPKPKPQAGILDVFGWWRLLLRRYGVYLDEELIYIVFFGCGFGFRCWCVLSSTFSDDGGFCCGVMEFI